MSLVTKFLESTSSEELYEMFDSYFKSNGLSKYITDIGSSDSDGAIIKFTRSAFSNGIIKDALAEINKELAEEGTEAFVLDRDYRTESYDIEEREIEYHKMNHGTIDFSGGYDTHYRFEKPAFGVILPDGRKVIYVKTKELDSNSRDNGIGQMRGSSDTWLYEPVTHDSESGYFIVMKDVVHPAAGEDCIATWYSGNYGDKDNVSADEFFGTENDEEDNAGPCNEEEGNAVVNILNYFMDYTGMEPEDFSDSQTNKELYKEFKGLSFKDALECMANAIDNFLLENPDAKESFGKEDKDGNYEEFTVEDFYDIDNDSGIFELPPRK